MLFLAVREIYLQDMDPDFGESMRRYSGEGRVGETMCHSWTRVYMFYRVWALLRRGWSEEGERASCPVRAARHSNERGEEEYCRRRCGSELS